MHTGVYKHSNTHKIGTLLFISKAEGPWIDDSFRADPTELPRLVM